MNQIKVVMSWKPSQAECHIIETELPKDISLAYASELDDEQKKTWYESMDAYAGFPKPDILAVAKNLKMIQGMGHGINAVTPEAAAVLKERGIKLCKSIGSAVAIAEYMMMAMLVLGRRIVPIHNAFSAGDDTLRPRMSPTDEGPADIELDEKTLCVLGLGSIGIELCKRAKAFNMRLIGFQRTIQLKLKDELGLDEIHGPDSLHEALAEADFVGNTLPLTDETANIIDAKAIRGMKDNSYIVNVGRSGTMDEQAIYEALKSGKLAGAALDVWDPAKHKGQRAPSGRFPSDFPLHQYNVLLTPHLSGVSRELRIKRTRFLVENLKRLAAGVDPLRICDLDAGY